VNRGGSRTTDLMHAIIGIATEGAELLDPIKKMMFYGKQLDAVNLDEEVGDVLWYIAIYCTARGTTIEQIAEMNNKKLKSRYPEKFSKEKALKRDLKEERKVMEENLRMTYPKIYPSNPEEF
jgi:NTP pyrophosphatase (non-canonical NTP hydrolase)